MANKNPSGGDAADEFDIPGNAQASQQTEQPAPAQDAAKADATKPPAKPEPEKPKPIDLSAYKPKLSDSFGEGLKELARLQDLPETLLKQKNAKDAAIDKLQKHLFVLQQGTPSPKPDAAKDMEHFKATTAHALETQWETLCRTHPVARSFAEQYEALIKERNALAAKVTEYESMLQSLTEPKK